MPTFYNTKHKYYQLRKLRSRRIETIVMGLKKQGLNTRTELTGSNYPLTNTAMKIYFQRNREFLDLVKEDHAA
jgi:hypothetical protein